jgi:predicted ribosome quality control (RQC) complex YloA/Tae2 family protein
VSLSSTEIARVVAELAPLVGGRVQKIWVPEPRLAILELFARSETHLLLLSAIPDETRIHRATERPASPPTPHAFQGLLRAHLEPARLASLEAVPGDRVVRLGFETPQGRRTLVGELTGRHGNLLLLGPDDRILGLAVTSSSTTRPLRVGDVHTLPPPHPTRERPSRFEGVEGEGFPLSRAIEAHYAPIARERELREERREASRILARARKRFDGALDKLSSEAARAKDAEELRRLGDLLKPLVGRIERGSSWVEATEYTEAGPRTVRIPLRPELSPKENLERYFKEYRRMLSAGERIEARRAELLAQRERVAALEARLAEAETRAEVEEVLAEARRWSRRGVSTSTPEKSVRLPYRRFRSATGRTIWVGRSSKDNDALTFRTARGNDLWLHARGTPGAHVVVPLDRGQAPDDETFLDACALATHFSRMRDEPVAEIASTRVKHLRKPKGGPPGAAIVTQEKTTRYRVEPARIERLLRSEVL